MTCKTLIVLQMYEVTELNSLIYGTTLCHTEVTNSWKWSTFGPPCVYTYVVWTTATYWQYGVRCWVDRLGGACPSHSSVSAVNSPPSTLDFSLAPDRHPADSQSWTNLTTTYWPEDVSSCVCCVRVKHTSLWDKWRKNSKIFFKIVLLTCLNI